MPYRKFEKTVEGKKKYCIQNLRTKKVICYETAAKRETGIRMREAFAHGMKPLRKKETADNWLAKKFKKHKWTRDVDKRMKSFGDIDYEKKKIRINPAKGDVLDTVAHEELHRIYPNKTEKQIRELAKKRIRSTSLKQKVESLKKYIK